jgi:hypothetical protein
VLSRPDQRRLSLQIGELVPCGFKAAQAFRSWHLAITRAPDMAGRYWNRDKLPASTAVQVSRLSDPCFLIEIDLVAVVE